MVACNYVVICQRENVVGLCGNDFFNAHLSLIMAFRNALKTQIRAKFSLFKRI